MRYLEIEGGRLLQGEISIQGSKNAVLPILAGCIPGDGVCKIENCPRISDVEETLALMSELGCQVRREGHTVWIDASEIEKCELNVRKASGIRSSVLFLGALLGKMEKAVLPLPGGCAIGSRPIDLHLQVMEALGAVVRREDKIHASARELTGCRIRLPFPSVGATENAVLAAVQARGDTWIENTAREPEIDALCRFLNVRGARISRTPDGGLWIGGGRPLHGAQFRMDADRIVAGTYLLAAAATGGQVTLRNAPCDELGALIGVLRQMGVTVQHQQDALLLISDAQLNSLSMVETAPYPGFPTDLQSPLMAALCRAEGRSVIRETIFESRFNTIGQLEKMGARISRSQERAVVTGVPYLRSAAVKAPDLRGGAALVIGALQARGRSIIEGVEYISRGYEDISKDLRQLGALIQEQRK